MIPKMVMVLIRMNNVINVDYSVDSKEIVIVIEYVIDYVIVIVVVTNSVIVLLIVFTAKETSPTASWAREG